MKAQIQSLNAKMKNLDRSTWKETGQLLDNILSLPVVNMTGINQLTGEDRVEMNTGFLREVEEMINGFQK